MSVLGSVNILGNPARLMVMLRNGIVQMVERPKRVATLGPAAVVLASLQGVNYLLRSCLASTLHFLNAILGAVVNGVVFFSFDDNFIDKRRELNRF